MGELKKHFKLYKAGKQWCVASVATLALAVGVMAGGVAYADQTPAELAQQTATVNQTAPQPVDNGNYGWVDSAKVNQNNLQVQGWQATNQATNKLSRYVIAVDQTNGQELGRTKITQSQNRPDVAKVYPQVTNAAHSGYQATMINLNWNKVNDVNDQIKIVSRYTNDSQHGEGQHVDYWSNQPVQLDKNNYGYLDKFTINNNRINVAGWNATNQALGKPHHFVILFDQTANRELGRQMVGNDRPDVARVYPQVINASKSGFTASFSLANVDINHDLRIISRYSNALNGEGRYADYWFNVRNFSPVDKSNNAYLDSFNISNGNVVVSGWHATNYTAVEPHHFLILFDNTSHRQVASVKVQNIARPDVARVYRNISSARYSGFAYTFNNASLTPGHTYSLVSRYSTTDQGNGDAQGSKFTDSWLTGPTLNQSHSYVDSFTTSQHGYHVAGWMVSDNVINRQNAYVILMNNGHEISRAKLNLFNRPDVARVYPQVYKSLTSGFSTDLSINTLVQEGSLQLILRFSDDPAGNHNYSDQYSSVYSTNAGSFDAFRVNGNAMQVSGWHAVSTSASRPYQYLIMVDKKNGHEFARWRITNGNLSRNDVARVYPWITNSSRSGFNVSLNIPGQAQGKLIQLIHRYTDDPVGNGNAVDYLSSATFINIENTWRNITARYGRPISIAVQLPSGEVHAYTNVPGHRFVTASTTKVAVLAQLLHVTGGNLDATQQDLAQRMIRYSDNDATSTILYRYLGGVRGCRPLFQALGMNSTSVDQHWGYTETTATDQLRLLHEIFMTNNSFYLNQKSQNYIKSLMGSVSAGQNWGISAGSSRFFVKNGWNTKDGSLWNVSSIGYIPNGGYTIAVYTDSNPNMQAGIRLIEDLARATNN